MTLEMGKPLAESSGEITYAAEFLRWFSEEAVRIDGRYAVNPAGAGRLLTMKQAIGPCLLITPWNFPTAMGTRKIGPAIAAGCTMVVKPAQQTPLSMLALAALLREAGLPDGVLNVITTSKASDVTGPLFDDRRLRKMSFTGSTPVGKTLMKLASHKLVKCSMELGGNAPFLVFADADLDARRRPGGHREDAQRRRVLRGGEPVPRPLLGGRRVRGPAQRQARRHEGRPRAPRTVSQVGPLIDATQRGKVAELVDDAVGKGAKVLTGGGDRR